MTFGSTRGSVPVVLRLPSVRPHTAVASEPAYGGGHGDDRQAGGQGDRLRQARGGAAADADDRVHVVCCGGFAAAGGHFDRDVHHHVVVAEQDAQVPGKGAGGVHLPLGRDHHDPAGAEFGDLALEAGGGLAGAEADPLRKGVVDEAHVLYLPAVWQERPSGQPSQETFVRDRRDSSPDGRAWAVSVNVWPGPVASGLGAACAYRSKQMADHARDYAFPHAGANERRRLELFAERLDPLTMRRIKALDLATGALTRSW